MKDSDVYMTIKDRCSFWVWNAELPNDQQEETPWLQTDFGWYGSQWQNCPSAAFIFDLSKYGLWFLMVYGLSQLLVSYLVRSSVHCTHWYGKGQWTSVCSLATLAHSVSWLHRQICSVFLTCWKKAGRATV